MKIISNIDSVIEQLRKYRDDLDEKTHILLERLAEIGISTAAVRFQTAQYDGDNDVIVNQSPEWVSENKMFLTASGNAVAFIEFGTGVHYTEQHPTADKVGAVRGTYGQGKGSRNSWGYYGNPGTNGRVIKESEKGQVVLTQGNPPARAMYDATKEMREQVLTIAKEVFGK